MKTYQVEEAVEKFRSCFDEAGLSYEIVDSDVNQVRINVTRDDVTLTAWFDVKQQLWGFDLLPGGHKCCDKFEEFEDYFGTYLSIHTVFIPNAKVVTDAFEREVGINTVFDNFSGNKQNGYTAKFKVLGAGDQSVLVKRVPEGYLIRLVTPDEISGKFKVLAEYKYEISEDGKAVAIPTIHMFVKRLKERYADDSQVKIQRVGENLFTFSIEGLVITAGVTFNYMEVRYKISEVSCYDADLLVTPEDPYDLSAVYMTCKDYYDDCTAGEEDGSEDGEPEVADADVADEGFGFSEEGSEDGFEPDDSAGESGDEPVEEHDGTDAEGAIPETSYTAGFGHEEAETFRQEEAAAGKDADKPFDDDFGDEIPQGEDEGDLGSDGSLSLGDDEGHDEPEDSGEVEDAGPADAKSESAQSFEPVDNGESHEPEAESQEGTSNVNIVSVESIKKVVEDGKTVGVQFIVDGQPYIFGVERVKEAGLPVKRIKETVNVVYKCGMRMTEDELRLKKYSDEYDDPGEVLKTILEAVFA